MSICFAKQWRDENGNLRAIPHANTKNTSFLRTCQLLKRMGIANHFFPLTLYDPDLMDVDVHDLEENTPENEILRMKVLIEARRNVWYFLRECVRIYSSGGDPVRFRLDRNSCAMAWSFACGIDYAAMAPRQFGKTICAIALVAWIIYCSGKEFTLGHMAKDNNLREENVKRVRTLGESLPPWWLAEDKFRDKKNTTEIYYHALGTHFVTFVANPDPRKADLQARGSTQPVFWWDEFEFSVNIGVSYPTIIASTTTARENAKMNGKPHSNLITTTAGDPTNPACKEAAKILAAAMPFSEQLYDIEDLEKLHEVVQNASKQKLLLGVFSHLQLGKDNAWLRDIVHRTSATKEQVMRDYLNRRVSIAEEPIIPAGTLAAINSSQMEPKYLQILPDKTVLYWYLDKSVVESQEFRQKPIIVGCDSSEMIGRDATTLVGIDPATLETVFTFRTAVGNVNKVGVMIAKLLMMYPKMIWVPENKSTGTSMIDVVSLILRNEGHNPFTRIFNWVVQNRNEQNFAKINIRDTALLDTEVKKYFGIKTDKNKRDQLYGSVLLEACAKAARLIRDRALVTELSGLTAKNGRVDHEEGSHDDTVMAWLMAMWFIIHGKHLDIYGIRPGTVMAYAVGGRTDELKLTLERVAVIQAKLEQAEVDYKNQKDPSMKRYLQSDIAVFKRMLEDAPTQTPEAADDLSRDPRRFTDRQVAERSRTPVDAEEVERSMRLLMGLS